jgi:hypothetical protein
LLVRVVLICLLAVPAACSSGPPSVLPAPSNAGDCGAASDPGNPDGGVVAGLEWPGGVRKLGAAARAYVCVGFADAVGTLSTPPGVSILPATFSVIPGGNGVVPVTVTVRRSGRATLWLRLRGKFTGKITVTRPVADVVADGSGWHFAAASQ